MTKIQSGDNNVELMNLFNLSVLNESLHFNKTSVGHKGHSEGNLTFTIKSPVPTMWRLIGQEVLAYP